MRRLPRWALIASSAVLLFLISLTVFRFASSSAESRPLSPLTPSDPNERIASYTLWLTCFTGVLAVVSIVQIGFLLRGDATTRIAAEAAMKAADAAKASADALPMIERAYVFLDGEASRHASRDLPKGIGPECRRHITFTNFGRTPAIVQRIACTFEYFKGEPSRIPLHEISSLPRTESPLGANQSIGPFEVFLSATPREIERAERGDGLVLLVAAVHYEDMLGRDCETGFCWQYFPEHGTFLPSPSKILNYHV